MQMLLPLSRVRGKTGAIPLDSPEIRKEMEEARNTMKNMLVPEVADSSAEELCTIAFDGLEAQLDTMERISAILSNTVF